MRREPTSYLWDADQAAGFVLDFAAGRALDDLHRDPLLRSAIERQLQNMGEALAQLSQAFPGVAARIPKVDQIIGFRNVLVHGYHQLNYATVWMTITDDVPALRTQLQALLREATG